MAVGRSAAGVAVGVAEKAMMVESSKPYLCCSLLLTSAMT